MSLDRDTITFHLPLSVNESYDPVPGATAALVISRTGVPSRCVIDTVHNVLDEGFQVPTTYLKAGQDDDHAVENTFTYMLFNAINGETALPLTLGVVNSSTDKPGQSPHRTIIGSDPSLFNNVHYINAPARDTDVYIDLPIIPSGPFEANCAINCSLPWTVTTRAPTRNIKTV